MNKTVNKILLLGGGGLLLILFSILFTFSNNFAFTGKILDLQKKGESFMGGELELEKDNRITLMAVGDLMLARTVEQKMIAYNNWEYPFVEIYELTSGADIAFGNLETPIVEGAVVQSGSFLFRTDPKAMQGLKFAGFDVLSLANNHMTNFGRRGLVSTLENLDGASISHIGAGISAEEISKPVIKEIKGIKFGFLAYSYSKDQLSDYEGGIYGTAFADTEKMKAEVTELAQSVDVVVVSMHSGVEYETSPSSIQKSFARGAVDAGADLVIGHHPHVVQTAEKYKDGYIFYSLGNFVFDQMWSEETRLGAVAKVTFTDGKISRVEFIPVKIFDYCQPQILEGQEAEKILERLRIEE